LTNNTDGYEDMAANMIRLAKQQQGFRGFDNARNQIGISVSYWDDLESIKNWKRNTDHLIAQQQGKEQWYQWYHTRICKVEHEYNMN
jgi:heme-degrading monooxygenase HmoA